MSILLLTFDVSQAFENVVFGFNCVGRTGQILNEGVGDMIFDRGLRRSRLRPLDLVHLTIIILNRLLLIALGGFSVSSLFTWSSLPLV